VIDRTMKKAILLSLVLSAASAWAQSPLNEAVRPNTLAATICAGGHAADVRQSPERVRLLKLDMMKKAGMDVSQASAHQLHHIVPLKLGGATVEENLQLRPLAMEKSPEGLALKKEGTRLKALVCSGQKSLLSAQQEIAIMALQTRI